MSFVNFGELGKLGLPRPPIPLTPHARPMRHLRPTLAASLAYRRHPSPAGTPCLNGPQNVPQGVALKVGTVAVNSYVGKSYVGNSYVTEGTHALELELIASLPLGTTGSVADTDGSGRGTLDVATGVATGRWEGLTGVGVTDDVVTEGACCTSPPAQPVVQANAKAKAPQRRQVENMSP